MSTSRPGLRADIQGLRAVAVLTVIASHAFARPVTGGFVGVDVFFVISGFLITQLLVREVAGTGRLSILGFYARRARRILPAATLVLVATAIATALWLGPVRAPEALRDTVWAAFFAANIRFARSGTDYFGQGLPPSPVQHYWSLAVEEQFYLVWPLVMLVVLVALTGRPRRRPAHAQPPYRELMAAIAVLSVASLVWSVLQTAHRPTVAYFSTATRGWELGLGALGALWLARRAARDESATPTRPARIVGELAAGLALVVIVVVCLTYDAATPFPGWQASLPVVASLVLLVVGGLGGPHTLVDRMLSLRPLRTVGDWSYSLYLWHWPLLVIPVQYLGRELRPVETIVALLVTFVLSGLSYRFVENPFRSAAWLRRPVRAVAVYPVTVALVAAAAAGGSAAVAASVPRGTPAITLGADWRTAYHTDDQAEALVRASVQAAREGHGIPGELHPALADLLQSTADVGDCDYEDDSVRRLCPSGDVGSDRTLVVIGNSHARHWIPAFDRLAKDLGYRTFYLVKVQCVGALVTPDVGTSSEPFTACAEFHDWAIEQIGELHPDLVVVSTSPTNRGVYDAQGHYLTKRRDVARVVGQGYVDLLTALTPLADRVALLLDIPYLTEDPGTCLGAADATLASCLLAETANHQEAVADQARAAEEAGVEAVPTRQWYCDGAACPAVTGDLVPYRDAGHMTNEYSSHLAPELADRLGLSAR
ncbi:MAG: acyltransferase family protein [Nocardioides sp.]